LTRILPRQPGEEQPPGEPAKSNPPRRGAEKKGEVKTPALKAFGRDLTEIARKGDMDPVIGRKNEIERVIQILCRRTKNNPVLSAKRAWAKRPSSKVSRRKSQRQRAGNFAEQARHHARPRADGCGH
jgi:ATP-dependent Clp protease ATP-binding subunit ClpC